MEPSKIKSKNANKEKPLRKGTRANQWDLSGRTVSLRVSIKPTGGIMAEIGIHHVVAAVVQNNRSADMVEALFFMHRDGRDRRATTVGLQAASAVKDDEDAGKMVQQTLESTEEHHHHHHQHQSRSPSNRGGPMTKGLIIGSGKRETQMASELIRSCVSTCLVMQMCTEKQRPPADVDQMMEIAKVSSEHAYLQRNRDLYGTDQESNNSAIVKT
ncbi:hypothetical protein Bca4012_067419 [Brassica carinata]